MREFVSAGGELIIHGALQLKNSPTPELIKNYIFTLCFQYRMLDAGYLILVVA